MLLSCGVCATGYLVPILLHAEVGAAVLHEHVRLHKGLGVQQKLHSLPGCQLTLQHTHQVNTHSPERTLHYGCLLRRYIP